MLVGSETSMHFTKSTIINGHKLQGDTFDENTKIHCTFENNNGVASHNGLRHLYVTASRVRNEKQISFASGTAELIKNCFNSEPMVGIKPDWSGNNNDLIKKIIDTQNQGGDFNKTENETFSGSYYNILIDVIRAKKSFNSKKELDSNSLVLGNKQNSLITPRKAVTSTEKTIYRRLRDSVDIELSKLLPVHIPNKESNQPVFIHKNSPDSYKNIVLEIDELPKEEQLKLLHQHRKLIYRAIWSGRESVHFWFRVENANKDNYKQIAVYLDQQLFNNQCCVSKKQPAHSLVRAPNVIRPTTGELQEVIFNKRNIITVDLPEIQEPVQPESTQSTSYDNAVEYYFNLCKNDHDGKNGGRGELILAKTFKQQREHNWDNGQCRQLIELLCREWGCTDKIGRLQSYFN